MKNFVVACFILGTINLLLNLGSIDQTKVKDKYNSLTVSNKTELKLSWKQDVNSLSLLNQGEVVWQLNYDKSEDKPYFYPLRTLNGIDLALKRPEDHPWHRGLWFAWKYINGINYWEEEPGVGISDGRSLIKSVEIEKRNDFSAVINIYIDYSPDTGSVVMSEERTLLISSPNPNGNYNIDWNDTFTVGTDSVTLDRTLPAKFGGETWGGYAGLGYRANDNELSSIRFMNSEGWTNEKSLTGFGEKANWMDLTGICINSKNKKAGLTIFDDPSNPRHPSPWYIWFNKDGDGTSENYNHAFFQPALLFNKPYKLGPGESFSLKYRILVHSGKLQVADLNKKYQEYIDQ